MSQILLQVIPTFRCTTLRTLVTQCSTVGAHNILKLLPRLSNDILDSSCQEQWQSQHCQIVKKKKKGKKIGFIFKRQTGINNYENNEKNSTQLKTISETMSGQRKMRNRQN